MQIVVINGLPMSGKDAFVRCCQKHMIWCGNFSTVDFVKVIAAQCGWDGTKTPANRRFLSDLKDLLTEWNDVPFKMVEKEIYRYEAEAESYGFDTKEVLCFIHCREPWEIKKIVDRLGAKTLFIQRPGMDDNEQSNHADAEVAKYDYDYTIINDGTLDELQTKAFAFLTTLGYKNLKN